MIARGPREATVADAAELAALHSAVADSVGARLGEGYWSKHRTVRKMKDRLADAALLGSTRHYFVWEHHGIVSTIMLRTQMAHFWRKGIWREPAANCIGVFDLAVLPTYHRMGLGTIAMRYAEEVARMVDAKYVRLDAFSADPRSNAFYLKLGYECRGRITVSDVELNLYEKQV